MPGNLRKDKVEEESRQAEEMGKDKTNEKYPSGYPLDNKKRTKWLR